MAELGLKPRKAHHGLPCAFDGLLLCKEAAVRLMRGPPVGQYLRGVSFEFWAL